jgi:hypothetical protein
VRSVKYLAESRSAIIPFYTQLSFVLSSVSIAQWLQSGLHLKCYRNDGSFEIDETIRCYCKFLSEMANPVVFNVPLFFAKSFKSLVLELFNILFSVNDTDASFFIGDILCRLLHGGADAAKSSNTSLARQFFLDYNNPPDLSTVDLLKLFATWRRQSQVSSSFHFSPSVQAEYESQHPYSQKHCNHSVKFDDNVKHIELSFDSRCQTLPNDTLGFHFYSKDKVALLFSGIPFANCQDSDSQGPVLLAGNELEAIFECIDETFEEEQALWGYKFTASGFPVSLSTRQSMRAVADHLKCLFEDLLMTVCAADDQILFPPDLLDSEDLLNEASVILSEKLTVLPVRKALEHIFFEEFSGISVSKSFIKLFQRSIHFAALNRRAVSPIAVCGRCTAGHFCKITNGIPLEPMYNSGCWSCDICKQSMSRDQANVWHCSICLFDVCPTCQPDLIQRQNSEFHVGDAVHLVPPEIADYRSFSDASSGPMTLGVEYSIRDVRPPHVNVEGSLQCAVVIDAHYHIGLPCFKVFESNELFSALTLAQVGGMSLVPFESLPPNSARNSSI